MLYLMYNFVLSQKTRRSVLILAVFEEKSSQKSLCFPGFKYFCKYFGCVWCKTVMSCLRMTRHFESRQSSVAVVVISLLCRQISAAVTVGITISRASSMLCRISWSNQRSSCSSLSLTDDWQNSNTFPHLLLQILVVSSIHSF